VIECSWLLILGRVVTFLIKYINNIYLAQEAFMKKNVGQTDKIIRYVLALVFIILAITVSWIFWIFAVVAAVTAYTGFCPIYGLLGIKSNKGK
jgi:hypothetical protein